MKKWRKKGVKKGSFLEGTFEFSLDLSGKNDKSAKKVKKSAKKGQKTSFLGGIFQKWSFSGKWENRLNTPHHLEGRVKKRHFWTKKWRKNVKKWRKKGSFLGSKKTCSKKWKKNFRLKTREKITILNISWKKPCQKHVRTPVSKNDQKSMNPLLLPHENVKKWLFFRKMPKMTFLGVQNDPKWGQILSSG